MTIQFLPLYLAQAYLKWWAHQMQAQQTYWGPHAVLDDVVTDGRQRGPAACLRPNDPCAVAPRQGLVASLSLVA